MMWYRWLAQTRSRDLSTYTNAWVGSVLMAWPSQCPGGMGALVSLNFEGAVGPPASFQCRDSVGRVKGGLRPSPAAISLRFTLDSAHGITG